MDGETQDLAEFFASLVSIMVLIVGVADFGIAAVAHLAKIGAVPGVAVDVAKFALLTSAYMYTGAVLFAAVYIVVVSALENWRKRSKYTPPAQQHAGGK